MLEILPGVWQWTALHERIRLEVSSYRLADGTLIDPMLPTDGVAWFAEHGPPGAILLTNRHHYRHSGDFVAAFGCSVHCHRAGLHEFTHGEVVEPFEFGDALPGGTIAHEIGAICPEETALLIPAARAVAIADGIVRFGAPDAPLAFVPDFLLGDEPEPVKAGLLAAFGRLLDEAEFDHLLLAHGGPVIDGRAELERFVAGAGA